MAFEDLKPYADTKWTKLDMDVINGVSPDYDTPPWTPEEKAYFARDFRNSWLAATDWTVGNDSPLSDEQKAVWIEYRQALRDMMNVDNIDDIVVPVPPDINLINPHRPEEE